MSRTVALVSCVKSKRSTPAAAGELYTSALFTSCRQYAERNADGWYILSAEHGLLDPGTVISPYEKTLNRMRAVDRTAWAEKVKQQLEHALPLEADVIILAGERYRENITPFLRARGHCVHVPLEGLPFGKQLQKLKELNEQPR
jgi:hypothetical protein